MRSLKGLTSAQMHQKKLLENRARPQKAIDGSPKRGIALFIKNRAGFLDLQTARVVWWAAASKRRLRDQSPL